MKEKNQVCRITIDERLSDDLIRILVAELKTSMNQSGFNDNVNSWQEEESDYISQENWGGEIKHQTVPCKNINSCPKKKTLPDSSSCVKKYPFSSLYEGQVFLWGNVTKNSSNNSNNKYQFTKSSKRKLLDITSDVKEDIKTLYMTALTGGKSDE